MIKPPYTKWINDIKTKLGFNRAMTASGEDVVDAVNKQARQIANLGPYNGLDSESTTAALSALQGKRLNDRVFLATNEAHGTSTYTDSWLLSAKNGLYKSSGGDAIGSIIEGANNTYGILLIFSPFTYDAVSTVEEYCTLLFAAADNSLYYRNFYRRKSTNTITWRGPLKKITTN